MNLADLKPSDQAPIDLETLRGLPLGGWYCAVSWSTGELDGIARIAAWRDLGLAPLGLNWLTDGGAVEDWVSWHHPADWAWRYPKLPRLSFALTVEAISTPGDQPSGRCKSVTRRGKRPTWAGPGSLFLAVDKVRASGARGLGVFRIVVLDEWGRWLCKSCDGFNVAPRALEGEISPGVHPEPLYCSDCGWAPANGRRTADTLTPRELELEGFPDADANEFWRMLEKGGQVRDGRTWRIAFEAV